MKSTEIREKFLKYFEGQGHRRIKSSSLIPASDPTLLFTNSGMVQFKDCFLGRQDVGTTRATTSQKCVRAGGKHNDLENVGFTARHHTFFEMLGNFSFGDYFKKEAIAFAWELLTKGFAIPQDRLRVTVFEKDDEAYDLWKAQGVSTERLHRLGEADNFWAMGDTGPCGPCSEIHFDWGTEHAFGPTDTSPGGDSTRFVEIWNLVFMQFNRDSSGVMTPLPKPSVDTGAGLERVSAVLQGVYSNYDTDLFTPLLHAIAGATQRKYVSSDPLGGSMRVIADHLRAGTFLLSDGVHPNNEGRGYVLRRILRRAIRHGKNLGKETPFLYELVPQVVEIFKSVYPELVQNQKAIQTYFQEEETRFHETLHRGMGVLEESLSKLKGKKGAILSGDVAFKLYDTFGFPLDLIEVIAREQEVSVDQKGFDALMEKQRTSSQWSKADDSGVLESIGKHLKNTPTQFLGYDTLTSTATLQGLFDEKGAVASTLPAGAQGYAVLEATPFYAEGGGQVGDRGVLKGKGGEALIDGTFKIGPVFVHRLRMEKGTLGAAEGVELSVDAGSRKATAINHTATHLLHAALRRVLGDRVKQAGSLVDPQRLRFDFTFPRAMTPEEIRSVEDRINAQVWADAPVSSEELPYDEAIQRGAMAFFDEKYGDKVRVIRVGDVETLSMELCGGTHLKRIGDISVFRILSESSVASGVRRIEAVTSKRAVEMLTSRSEVLLSLEGALGVPAENAVTKLAQLQTQLKTLQKENEALKLKTVSSGASSGGSLWDKKIAIKGVSLIRESVHDVNPKLLRTLVDQVRDHIPERCAVLLATTAEGKVSMCLGLTKDLAAKWNAGTMIRPLAELIGGTGGGKPDFAQAGGAKIDAIPQAFQALEKWIESQ